MAKGKPTEYMALSYDTKIEVVSIMPDGKTYIFDINILKWISFRKKAGIIYYAFQIGFSSFKDAIRIEHKD